MPRPTHSADPADVHHDDHGHDHDHDHDHDDAHDHDHDDHGHDHGAHSHGGHGHGAPGHGGHGHSHAPKDFGRAFLIGTLLNLGFVIVEAGYGFAANSMALVADAGHNLSDVLGLLVAWGAASLSKRRPSTYYTYGFGRSSILAALFNAVFLLVSVGAIGVEAVRRLAEPEPIAGTTVMIVAGIGILVNGFTALLFMGGRHDDLNVRGAFLHMVADAALSAGVVLAAAAVLWTGWLWLDPVASLAIVAVIVAGTWGLLCNAVTMSLDRVPQGIAPDRVSAALAKLDGVSHVHDLHIWPMSTTKVAMTCHLVMPAGCPGDNFLHGARAMLRARFGIAHVTIQVEQEEMRQNGERACVHAHAV
nr:cation diffusion facilitator family transporter [Sphingomonas bacterium]